ncbi:MAG: hypothetical protein ACOX8U_08315 [Bradymonadia bacterium]|jgi:hypothetical protein
MNVRNALILLSTFLLLGCETSKHSSRDKVELPVSKVVMYQSGVGYVERQGKIEGDELVLRIKANQINDILKSLTVIDRGKGRPVSISLPVDRKSLDALSDIPEQIADGGGILALLKAFRGANVLIKAKGKTVQGRVVGVEYHQTAIMPKAEKFAPTGEWLVTLMSAGDTLEVLKLSDIRSVEMFDKSLSVGLDKSLDVSLGAGDWKPIELRVRMSSKATRDIAMSYIVAMPTWKPAYRLLLDDNSTGTLQGWAVISNVSGSDWENIGFSLVSGQPMSFTYNLYSPLFVSRPDLSHQARTMAIAPRPQEAAYGGGGGDGGGRRYDSVVRENAAMRKEAKPSLMKMQKVDEAYAAYDSVYEEEFAIDAEPPRAAPAPISAEEYQSNFEALASTQQVGSFYEYKLESALTVPDGASALVNLLQQNVPSVEARLFDSLASRQTSSYQTVQLVNNSNVSLEAGPITIYKGSAFIGEGYMTRTDPGQTAQITFAADDRLTLSMVYEPYAAPSDYAIDRIEGGYVHVTGTIGESAKYTIENKADVELTALIKRPVRPDWSPSNFPKETLTSNGFYYVPVKVEAQKSKDISLQSTSKNSSSYSIMSESGARTLKDALPNSKLPQELRENIENFIAQYAKLPPIDDKISQLNINKKELESDQNQISASLRDLKDVKTASATALKNQLVGRQRANETQIASLATQLAELRIERSEIDITLRALVREMRYYKQ